MPLGPQVTPPAPAPNGRSRWGSAKSLTNLAIFVVWFGLLLFPGFFVNVYVFAGIDFDSDTQANLWAIAGVASLYGGVFLWAIIAQVLIVKNDVRWRALMPLWLLTPLTQVGWLFAYDWAGDKYGFICC